MNAVANFMRNDPSESLPGHGLNVALNHRVLQVKNSISQDQRCVLSQYIPRIVKGRLKPEALQDQQEQQAESHQDNRKLSLGHPCKSTGFGLWPITF